MKNSPLRLGAGAASAGGFVVGLALWAAVLATQVEAQSYNLIGWPGAETTPNVFAKNSTNTWFSAANFNGSVYVVDSYQNWNKGKPSNNSLDLLRLEIGSSGTLGNLSRVGQASSSSNFATTCQPATCVFNNCLYYFYTSSPGGEQALVWYGCYDGSDFVFQQNTINNFYSYGNYIAATVFDGSMVVFTYSFVNGVGYCLNYTATTDGVTWSAPASLMTVTAPGPYVGLAAASFYNSSTGKMNVMLTRGMLIPPAVTETEFFTDVWDGTTYTKNYAPPITTPYPLSTFTLQNGTLQGGTRTTDAMQLWTQCMLPNTGGPGTYSQWPNSNYQVYHYELALGQATPAWNGSGKLTIPAPNGSPEYGGSCQALCSAVVGSNTAGGDTVQQYVAVLGLGALVGDSNSTFLAAFAASYSSDQLVYDAADPGSNGLYDVAVNISSNSETTTQQLVTAVAPLGYIAGLPPFTYNGNSIDDVDNTFKSLSSFSLDISKTSGTSSSTTWAGSVSASMSAGIKDVTNMGLTAGYNLSQAVVSGSSFTASQSYSFDAPDMLNTVNDNGDLGYFFYEAPTLSQALYKRFTWDGSTQLQPDFNYVFVSAVSLGSFYFQLADPSQTTPAGFEYFTQGIPPLWNSTDLTSWSQYSSTVNGQILASNHTPAGTMTLNGAGPASDTNTWTFSQEDTNQHGYSLAITGSIGDELFNVSSESQGSVNFSTTNSTFSSNSGALTLNLPGIPSPTPSSCPIYSSYSVAPYWLQPVAGAGAPTWLPTHCQNLKNFFCLTYVVDAQSNDCLLTASCAPVNGGTATATASDAFTYSITALPANSSYVFSNWTVSTGGATLANPNSPTTTVTLTSDDTITANFITSTTPASLTAQTTMDTDERVSLTVESDNSGYCWTNPQKIMSVKKGETVSIDALTSRRGWVAFAGWSVKSGDAVVADPSKGWTSVTVNSDAIVRAEWRPNGTGLTSAQLKAIAVKIDYGKVSVKNMPLLIGRDALNDGPQGSVAIDATVFDMGALTPASGDVVSYVNQDGAKLTLDFRKSLWSFIAPENLLPSLVTSDGILIKLITGDEQNRYAIPLHETTTWQTGQSTTIPGLIKAKGTIASKASNSAISFTCSTRVGGVVPDPSKDPFDITIGDSFILVPSGDFKSSKGVYSYKFKSKSDTITVKVDTTKDTLSLDFSAGRWNDYYLFSKVDFNKDTRSLDVSGMPWNDIHPFNKVDTHKDTRSLDFSGWRWNDFDLFKGISVSASCGRWSKSFALVHDGSMIISRKLEK